MEFKELGLIAPILQAISEVGYSEATPIQERAIPIVLAGQDLIGGAQTGTGKTGAFSLPLLQLLAAGNANKQNPKALILAPTRELAIQIGGSFDAYSKHLKLKHAVIFGGVSQVKQVEQLQKSVETIIATPGRLLDLVNQGYINLSHVQKLVLDEADTMLDMGFIHDLKRILKLVPSKRQTLFFSATMPKAIRNLAKEILTNPKEVQVSPESSTAEKVSQSVYFVDKKEKTAFLTGMLRDSEQMQTLVFMRSKHGADRLSKKLGKSGILSVCLHGNKSQNARQKALSMFKGGEVDILIATDIAARGIDIEQLPRVINYDLPEASETYVHRIGRTGRAGKAGIAYSFCSDEEKPLLLKIQKLIGFQLPKGK